MQSRPGLWGPEATARYIELFALIIFHDVSFYQDMKAALNLGGQIKINIVLIPTFSSIKFLIAYSQKITLITESLWNVEHFLVSQVYLLVSCPAFNLRHFDSPSGHCGRCSNSEAEHLIGSFACSFHVHYKIQFLSSHLV